MSQTKRFNFAFLLILLPLLAAAILVSQHQPGHGTLAPEMSAKSSPVPTPSTLGSSPYSSFRYTPSAAQRAILKLRWKKSITLPPQISAAGSSLYAANTSYTLVEAYDVNGFQYYLTHDGAQCCQWSTLNFCWCIRSSLVPDSPGVRPSAEYFSRGGQTYQTGPAGAYGYGGMCPMVRYSALPIVKVLKTTQHLN